MTGKLNRVPPEYPEAVAKRTWVFERYRSFEHSGTVSECSEFDFRESLFPPAVESIIWNVSVFTMTAEKASCLSSIMQVSPFDSSGSQTVLIVGVMEAA